MNDQPVIVRQLLNASPATVWSAISNRDEMAKWYFNLAEFKPEKGFQFQFSGGPPEKLYLHLCEVTEAIPEKNLTYSWRYNGYTGISFVTFELEGKGGQTMLTLTHKGLETFPSDEPDFARKNFEAGWNEIINTSLKNYIDKSS